MSAVLVEARDVVVRFAPRGQGLLHAVDGASIQVHETETVGLVGESGSGKSTLGRALLGLVPVHAGQVFYRGQETTGWSAARWRPVRQRMQILLQDPDGALDSRMTVEQAIAEALDIHHLHEGVHRRVRLQQLLAEVGLEDAVSRRFPHELSSGQRQRVALARALAVQPEFLVCDEPVSALDASVRAHILNLLTDVQRLEQLAMLFISHDLAVVGHMATRVVVMLGGRVVEAAPTRQLFKQPRHPYTQALLASVPRLRSGEGLPGLMSPAKGERESAVGCPFQPRCPCSRTECTHTRPTLRQVAEGHEVACHKEK